MGEPDAKMEKKEGEESSRRDQRMNELDRRSMMKRSETISSQIKPKNSWKNKYGALYQAAKKYNEDGFIDALELVLEEDTELSLSSVINSVNESGDTLLHVAVNHGNEDTLRLIGDKFPCLLTRKNSKGDTVWHVAAKTQYVEVSKVLFNLRNDFIQYLSYSNDIDAKREVTWEDVSLREVNDEGNTALHVAMINRRKSMANQLVEQDWNLSYYVNNENKSALYLAAESGDLDTLKSMLNDDDGRRRYGRDVHEMIKGKSLAHAAIMGRNIDALKFLLELGKGFVFGNEEPWLTLHWAASIGFLESICYLIQSHSLMPTERDENGLYPIHWAAMNGHVDVIQELLRYCKALDNLLTHDRQNVLHVAAKNGKYNVVSYILKTPELGGLINMIDEHGNTPLHCATMIGHPRIVNALTWDNRVDLNFKNEDGFTPLDAAESNMKGTISFQQWLTWQALKVAGATRGLSNKITYGKGQTSSIQSKPTDYYKSSEIRSESSEIINDAKGQTTSTQSDSEPATMEYYKGKKKSFLSASILLGIASFVQVSFLVGVVSSALGLRLPGLYINSETAQATTMLGILSHIKLYLFIFCTTISMSGCTVVAAALFWSHLGNGNDRVFIALRFTKPLLGMVVTMTSLLLLSVVNRNLRKVHWFVDIILTAGLVFLVLFATLFFPLCYPFPSGYRILRYITYHPIRLMIFLNGSNSG